MSAKKWRSIEILQRAWTNAADEADKIAGAAGRQKARRREA
nr:MAG TPA: hypothetical protein [Caudoviricetes sp.]